MLQQSARRHLGFSSKGKKEELIAKMDSNGNLQFTVSRYFHLTKIIQFALLKISQNIRLQITQKASLVSTMSTKRNPVSQSRESLGK